MQKSIRKRFSGWGTKKRRSSYITDIFFGKFGKSRVMPAYSSDSLDVYPTTNTRAHKYIKIYPDLSTKTHSSEKEHSIRVAENVARGRTKSLKKRHYRKRQTKRR